MKLKCKEVVYSIFNEVMYTKGKIYEFEPIQEKYAKGNNYAGFFYKDDLGNKKWINSKLKTNYFEEVTA